MATFETTFGNEVSDDKQASQAEGSTSLPLNEEPRGEVSSRASRFGRIFALYDFRTRRAKTMRILLSGGIFLSIGMQVSLTTNNAVVMAVAMESEEATIESIGEALPPADMSDVMRDSHGPEHNADWVPMTKPFEGIEMVLVPAGCFMMGSESGSHDERPVHQQCFDEPFWIDRTEVTNEQHGARGYWPGQNRPRENISWFQAQDFCQSRGGRLPTEAEWEYAARGPDSLEYPWGNAFDGSRVVWYTFETVDVASKPEGASWVGALDMSGGVWEWTSSIYQLYPYDADDGREADTDVNHVDARVLRGGSWELTDADNLRAANRFSSYADDWGYGVIGFRCVRPY